MKKALVIISACNEAASLEVFLPRLMKTINGLPNIIHAEVMLIDDGSTDATQSVAKMNGCTVVCNKRNYGIGYSLRVGYKKAVEENFDFTVTLDADGQHDEAILPKVLEILLSEEQDIVIASRYHKESERMGVPIDRDLLNRATAAQINCVTGWNVTDPLTGFWGMTREYFTFSLKHSRQDKYGIHLENLIKFWYLCERRPRRLEIPHPAIYENHGTKQLLTRQYSGANKEMRCDRFGTHAIHIMESLDDVQESLGKNAVQVKLLEELFNPFPFEEQKVA